MAKDKQTIIKELTKFIDENGGNPKGWYVGIAADPKERLFNEHGVKDAWIHREALSASAARAIETYFIERLGTDGGSGGGDEKSKYVYAYKKKPHTNP